ncbi:MAG: hypothetical protein HY718_10670 [Planctomycetes bacterium]|nr:hypothetical protein [Planctomycetota bacterium]
MWPPLVTALCFGWMGGCAAAPDRFRLPAPAEDNGPLIEEPVFGAAAGHDGTDATLAPMEWVAKRTWHILDLPYGPEHFKGPPALKSTYRDGWVEVEAAVVDGGVPLRNQVITCEIEQLDEPLLILLRSTDAFGEVHLQLDLARGHALARSVTVSRTMIGGQSDSSPRPESSSNRIVATASFPPAARRPVQLRITAQGKHVIIQADGTQIFAFSDPDPAGGKFGFGSTGRMRVRNVQQWELISPREQRRRQACVREMHEFVRRLDAYYDGDVRERNDVRADGDGLLWAWPRTGATARFAVRGPRVAAAVRSGLYGNDLLVDGAYPEITVVSVDGEEFGSDPQRPARIESDELALRITLPLRSPSGRTATARVEARLTVQTVWFWTVTVENVQPKMVRAAIDLAGEFAAAGKPAQVAVDETWGLVLAKGGAVLRHNAKAGFYAKLIEPEHSAIGTRTDGRLGLATTDGALRFATVVLPAQPLNLVGFKNRMVHFIRYPEGPVQHWRRMPSFQEYPDNVDLARFAGHGTGAMVWHHTWINSDFSDREGFLVNDAEMRRAMAETHRLGMKAIGYLGIVPGRSSLLRLEDLSPGPNSRYGRYDKNWDLQDQTFYHVAGRYPEFLAWMADDWCKTYGLDGFYLDGGAFGAPSRGPLREPLHPEDAGLSIDELRHRAYYRIRKVLELNHAGYGLEPWSGLDWMLNGFYDCMMIGESFQEAKPEYYRDGHNALLTGCMIKMYGMRESSQNPYNIAMAAVNLSDIQVCSGNGAWGDDPDTTETWARVRPLWDLLASIDWDHLVEARPWYAQELVGGEGFFAGNYTEPRRVIVFLANQTEQAGTFAVRIDPARLPAAEDAWHLRYCLGRQGEIGPLGDGRLNIELPALHDGPIGIELVARR